MLNSVILGRTLTSSSGSGCALIDYDRDGLLDIFVANYVDFDLANVPKPATGKRLRLEGGCRSPLQMKVLLRLNAQCRHVVCRDETTPRALNQDARNNSCVLRRSRADLKRELWGF